MSRTPNSRHPAREPRKEMMTNPTDFEANAMTNDTAEYHAAEDDLFKLLHVNPNRVSHLSTDSIYKAARRYVAAVDAICET